MKRAILTVVALGVLAGLSSCVGPQYGRRTDIQPMVTRHTLMVSPFMRVATSRISSCTIRGRSIMPVDIPRTSSATRNLLILQAIHRAAALARIRSGEASGVAVVMEADARLRSPRAFDGCATSLPGSGPGEGSIKR